MHATSRLLARVAFPAALAAVSFTGVSAQVVMEDPPSTSFFLRGDSNGDSSLNIGDPVHILNFLFSGGAEPSCLKAADSNDDGRLDLSDAANLLNFLFIGPNPQLAPQKCGVDLVGDSLPCSSSLTCSYETLDLHWVDFEDNGQRCPDPTCPWITLHYAAGELPDEVITDVNADLFGFSTPEAQAQFETNVVAPTGSEPRLDVLGFVEAGPGPTGRTFVILSTAIHLDPRPDIVITKFALAGPAVPTKTGEIGVPLILEIYNQGRRSTETSFTMEIRMADSVLSTWTVGPLDGGGKVTSRRGIILPEEILGQRLLLTAEADTTNVVKEGSEDNNTKRLALNSGADCSRLPGGCNDLPDGCHIEIIHGKPFKICD